LCKGVTTDQILNLACCPDLLASPLGRVLESVESPAAPNVYALLGTQDANLLLTGGLWLKPFIPAVSNGQQFIQFGKICQSVFSSWEAPDAILVNEIPE
jgi:hypothetical protein